VANGCLQRCILGRFCCSTGVILPCWSWLWGM
jgi:hypothetical protein